MQRDHDQRQLDASLEAFLVARGESLVWLRELASPDWEQGFDAPFGRIRAGDVLAAWVAYDVLHTPDLARARGAGGSPHPAR